MTDTPDNKVGVGAQLGGALLFLVVALGAAVAFLYGFAPRPYEPPPTPARDYDHAAMQAALAPERVRAQLEAVAACGSRFLGQPGHQAVARLLAERYAAAGLELLTLDLSSVAPATQERRLLVAGQPSEVALYPFMPNNLQPMNTPPGGVTGELLLLTDEVLDARQRFDDCIGLLNLKRVAPKGYGNDWTRYAALGLRAVIVTHEDGLAAATWSGLSGMASANPVNYVRLAAEPGILAQVGRQVTLHVRTAYQPTPHQLLVARLPAGRPTGGALVIPIAYDAWSLLPDLAPGIVAAAPIAEQLALLDGLLPYRAEMRRDVIFVASGASLMAQDATNRLLAALGEKSDPARRGGELVDEQRRSARRLDQARTLVALFDQPNFFLDPASTLAALKALSEADRKAFEDERQFVLNTLVFELSEAQLQARIAFSRDSAQDLTGPAYLAYQEARKRYEKAFSNAGYNTNRLLREQATFVAGYQVRQRLLARCQTLLAAATAREQSLAQELALHRRFAAYHEVVVLAPDLLPAEKTEGKESLSLSMGYGPRVDYLGEQAAMMKTLLLSTVQQLGLKDQAAVSFGDPTRHAQQVNSQTQGMPVESSVWCSFSYPAFTLVHADRANSYRDLVVPVELPWMRHTETMARGLKVLGETTLSLAFGSGRFRQLRTSGRIPSLRGTVYVANVGQSIIPNYPLPGALLACRGWNANRGFFPQLLFYAGAEGKYEYPYCAVPFTTNAYDYSPDAVRYGADGRISHIKDQGLSAQSVFKSMQLRPEQMEAPVHLVVYRAAPVSLLDLINPQTLKAYAGADFIRQRGLAGFGSSNAFREGGIVTAFLPPDERVFVTLKAGAPDNEKVQTTRAFILGTPAELAAPGRTVDPREVHIGREVAGPGFLVADTPLLIGIPELVARSMIHVNQMRLAVQNQGDFEMADARTQDFQGRSATLLAEAARSGVARKEGILLARDAATYATLNHPVLRANIYEAIIGIMWYLGLLVPFAFFFEKLVCGFTDIRKQVLANLVIFLVAFALLKLLHPAFSMIRSSLMILLGFIIMIVSTGITVLFASKFQENLEEIRKRRGQVTAAEVNKLGVVATAFLLGLNNMHRRRVRTGLTCATLVLLTFVMICFTSVQSDLVDTQVAIGKAAYSGFLVKNEKFLPVTGEEQFALVTKYGSRYRVAARSLYVGTEDWNTKERRNPLVELKRTEADGTLRSCQMESVLRFSYREPLADRIKLLTKGGWFTQAQEEAQAGAAPVLISEVAAAKLNLTPEQVDAGEVRIKLNGEEVLVYGIFAADSLARLTDLDGLSLLPFDVTALRTVNKSGQSILAEEDDARLDPAQMVIAGFGRWSAPISFGTEMINSIAVVLPPDLGYKDGKQVIDQYLEQSGRSTYYGVDGFAFRGRRARETSIVGLVEMLIPLVIAALTVLNTMKGSVYERRDEIFVYNAVGIAPAYIFFMFFAEAFVYMVVGSVLGYLLSQGTGRVLSLLELTGGLNMTFTSMATIYVSLVIGACTFISTFFPARTASQIASPGTSLGWDLPPAEGDRMMLKVPFTFDARDRIAILAFFQRYFVDHGEGSSGAFFAGPPRLGLSPEPDALANGAYQPELRVAIWLKPFDLGVSQELTITLGTDPETGEFIPTLTLHRLSGTLDHWRLLNRRFIKRLRRHFLHWRAVQATERAEMFTEARTVLEIMVAPPSTQG